MKNDGIFDHDSVEQNYLLKNSFILDLHVLYRRQYISILDSFSRKSTWKCSADYSKDIELTYESRSFTNLACLEDISVQLSPCNDKKVDFLKRKKSFHRFSYYLDKYKGGHFTPTSADDRVNSECKRSKYGSISSVHNTCN